MTCKNDNCVIDLQKCSDRDHVLLLGVNPVVYCYKIKGQKKKFNVAYLINANDTPFVTEDVTHLSQ